MKMIPLAKIYVILYAAFEIWGPINYCHAQRAAHSKIFSSSRASDLEKKYNLTHARKGRQAVKEAVSFLIGQENSAAKHHAIRASKVGNSGRKKCTSLENCPLCVVSMNSIISEGVFEYRGNNSLPPYPTKCWAQSVRYHVAPECELEEAMRGVVPVYKWRWTLQSAVDGYCRMPDSSPPMAAATYIQRTNTGAHKSIVGSEATGTPPAKKTLNVLMLGLSFMGQPWQSLGCLYSDIVVGGAMSTNDEGGDIILPVMDVKKDGGVCSGYSQEKIALYHPPELHKNYSQPTQHASSCSADHSFAIYGSEDPDVPNVKVCFIYLFNVHRNVKPGHPLPCNLTWADIDILLTIPPHNEIKLYITNTGGNMSELSHVKVVGVNEIYEGLMGNQLAAAYKKQGFAPLIRDDYLAKYKKCGTTGADVHYRLPGMTDYAVQAWFSMIATGLSSSDDEDRKRTVGAMDFWY